MPSSNQSPIQSNGALQLTKATRIVQSSRPMILRIPALAYIRNATTRVANPVSTAVTIRDRFPRSEIPVTSPILASVIDIQHILRKERRKLGIFGCPIRFSRACVIFPGKYQRIDVLSKSCLSFSAFVPQAMARLIRSLILPTLTMDKSKIKVCSTYVGHSGSKTRSCTVKEIVESGGPSVVISQNPHCHQDSIEFGLATVEPCLQFCIQ